MPGHDLLVARLGIGIGRGQLEPIERTGAGQGLAPIAWAAATLPAGVRLTHQHRQQRIEAQPVVVIEILVAERQPEHPLSNQLPHTVLDDVGVAVVDKLQGQALDNTRPRLDFPQQQSAAVRTDVAPIELAHHRAAAQGVKFQRLGVTLCHRKAALLFAHKMLIAQPLCQRGRPFFNPAVRYSG